MQSGIAILESPVKRTVSAPVFYRPELDVLRFAAFLAVFITHAFPTGAESYEKLHVPHVVAQFAAHAVGAGAGGVVLFFMLSSYLITALLIREHNRTGTIDVKAFYIRRALRIWPLYFCFLPIAILTAPLYGYEKVGWVHIAGFLTFTENWVVVALGWPNTIGAPLWSVSVEEQFYLIWPVLLLLVGFSRLRSVAVACIAAAFVSRYVMISRGAEEIQLWESTLSHIDSIAVGALIAFAYRFRLPTFSNSARIVMVLGGALLPVLCGVLPAGGALIRYPVVTVGCALVLLGTLGFDLSAKKAGALVYLGKISFGLYVFHVGYIGLFNRIIPKFVVVAPAAFMCTVATAALSYHFLEMPFLRLKSRFAVVESRRA
jgi:peptidoglycan/LPS O-acetylase OafA/YrhL